jgi:signal transduction histidine kinase
VAATFIPPAPVGAGTPGAGILGFVTPREAPQRIWWERLANAMPIPLLALATTAAMISGPWLGTDTRGLISLQLALVAVALGAEIWGLLLRRAPIGQRPPQVAWYFVVRTVLAFALALISPLYALYAVVGFFDVADVFRGRRAQVFCTVVVAFSVAVGQAGGLPPSTLLQVGILVVMTTVSTLVVLLINTMQRTLVERAEQQRAVIAELERVNDELVSTADEKDRLRRALQEQARRAGVDEERRRLAREIHDTIAQMQGAALAQLRAAQHEVDPRERLERATELTRQALTETRRSVLDLAPAPLDDGDAPQALAEVVEDWNREQHAHASFTVTGEPRRLHPEVEATLVRVTQEALTNVARHAEAQRVGVTLSFDEAEVLLDVRDDGRGFDVDEVCETRSFGLRGMRQRAARLLGTVNVETAPGEGTALSLRLPAFEGGDPL